MIWGLIRAWWRETIWYWGKFGDSIPRICRRRWWCSIESKAIRRSLSLKIFDWGKVEPSGGNKVRQTIKLRRGLTEDVAKRITKLIRDEFPKAKSQIQGDAVRVSGKSRDELQRVITRLRELDEPVPLQFQNYR